MPALTPTSSSDRPICSRSSRRRRRVRSFTETVPISASDLVITAPRINLDGMDTDVEAILCNGERPAWCRRGCVRDP